MLHCRETGSVSEERTQQIRDWPHEDQAKEPVCEPETYRQQLSQSPQQSTGDDTEAKTKPKQRTFQV